MSAKFKVYVSDYDYPDLSIEKSILEPIGAEVIGLHDKTGEHLAELAADADAILQQYAKIMRPTIEKLKNCKVIARYGIGVDILDVKAAYDNGMVVTNVNDYCIDEVADQAIAFALMLMRNIPFYDAKVHAGSYRWQDWRAPITTLRSARFGLVGFGRIAQNLAHKIQAFGTEVVAYDPYVSKSLMHSHGVTKVELDELLKTSHTVIVLCPYTKDTHHIINEDTLRMMRKDAFLIEVSRGKCVDNKALYTALHDGWICGAALDDPEEEPMKIANWTPAMNPLFQLDNCFFTPHTAYVSSETLVNCRYIAAENVRAVLLGERPMNLVKP